MPSDSELVELEARREELRKRYLHPAAERESTPGRGIHHAALICSDVEQTIEFYQGLLGFPLVELVENRDYPGSSHFFFDLGNKTLLGFFDFPGLGLEPGVEAHREGSSTSRSRLRGTAGSRYGTGWTPPA